MMLRRVLLVSYVQYVMYSLVARMHNMNDARGGFGVWVLGPREGTIFVKY